MDFLQHHQYISQRSLDFQRKSHDHDARYDDVDTFHIPTLEETVETIISEAATGSTDNHTHLATPPYCVPLFPSNRTGQSLRFPASSCQQVRQLNSSAVSGLYWVDPNLGCSADAILVFCNFTSNHISTCISPAQRKVSQR